LIVTQQKKLKKIANNFLNVHTIDRISNILYSYYM